MFNKHLKLGITLVLLCAVALSACGGDKDKKEEPTTVPKTAVSIQFAWVHTMEYSGFYLAQDQGLYANENLDVDLKVGGFDADGNFIFSIAEVAADKADFGLIGGDQLLKARSEGQPLVALAVIYQRSPVVLMSLAEKNILKPDDLVGKSVAIDLETATGLSFLSLLGIQGISLDDITIVDRTDFTNDLLTSGQVDVLDGFITNQPIVLVQEGYDLNLLLPSDYGVDLYTNVIFTTEDMIANQPDVVARFLRATLLGYQAVVDNPQAAAESAVARNASLLLDNELAGTQASLPLIDPMDSEIGVMTSEVWQVTYDLLLAEGIIQTPFEVSTAYNLNFLNDIYKE